jgi:hypothetical protein
MDIKKRNTWWCRGSSQHGPEHSGSIKAEEFIHQLSNCWLIALLVAAVPSGSNWIPPPTIIIKNFWPLKLSSVPQSYLVASIPLFFFLEVSMDPGWLACLSTSSRILMTFILSGSGKKFPSNLCNLLYIRPIKSLDLSYFKNWWTGQEMGKLCMECVCLHPTFHKVLNRCW